MKKSAIVILAGIAAAAVAAGILWARMPPLGYDWAPAALTDWQRIRTAKSLVVRVLNAPGPVEFRNVRVSDRTLYGIKKKSLDPQEADFFAVCGEFSDGNATDDAAKFKKFAVHFDRPGGRARAFTQPSADEMPEESEDFASALRPCR